METFAVPATTAVARALAQARPGRQTILEILESAGVQVGPPSCAACLGGPEDTFGRLQGDAHCLATTNRNFPGRMGSARASVFLASPLTVAASAIAGRFEDPRKYLE